MIRDGSPEPSGSPVPAEGLVERDGEIAAIEAFLRDIAAGRGGVALVEGAAGVGKSALVDEARRRAKTAGFHVARARGGPSEQRFELGVAGQLLSDAVKCAARGDGSGFALLDALYKRVLALAARAPVLLAVDGLPLGRPSVAAVP